MPENQLTATLLLDCPAFRWKQWYTEKESSQRLCASMASWHNTFKVTISCQYENPPEMEQLYCLIDCSPFSGSILCIDFHVVVGKISCLHGVFPAAKS